MGGRVLPADVSRQQLVSCARHTYVSGVFSAVREAAVRFLLVNLAALYIRFLGLTTRVTVFGEKTLPEGPFIYAFWHCRLLFFVHSHRSRGIRVLVSRSKDGKLIASVINKFGFKVVHGSSSRGGRESVARMIKSLRENRVCAITPDGPRGPAREVKDGISYIARKTGCPVVPIANAFTRKKFLKSWDRFLLPLPFSRAVIVAGDPVYVRPGDDLGDASREIAASIDRVTLTAEMLTRLTGKNQRAALRDRRREFVYTRPGLRVREQEVTSFAPK
ncbi:MAG: lysophospholipid acyltransferase family protein [Endomicrobiales bacterium]